MCLTVHIFSLPRFTLKVRLIVQVNVLGSLKRLWLLISITSKYFNEKTYG